MTQQTSSSIFTQIMEGHIPCHCIYSDSMLMAFLDVNPLSIGHTLVVPREPAKTMDTLSDASAAALGLVLPRICRAIIQVTNCSGYNLLQNNAAIAHQAVPHVHVHIIPKYTVTSGLQLHWAATALDHSAAALLAKKIHHLI